VSDLERSIVFYGGALGLDLAHREAFTRRTSPHSISGESYPTK